MTRTAGSALLSTLLLATTASGAPSDDRSIKNGHDWAVIVCSACHVVARDQDSPPKLANPGPPFQEIADNPNTTVASLRKFLSATHGSVSATPATMPDLKLSETEISEVIAYIRSLKHKP